MVMEVPIVEFESEFGLEKLSCTYMCGREHGNPLKACCCQTHKRLAHKPLMYGT